MRLIIDCDPGNGVPGANVDDGLALALAIAAPEIALELITIVAGNTPSEVGFSVAHDLVNRLGLSVPIVRGASQALVEPPEPWRDKLDNGATKSGLTALWQQTARPPVVAPNAPLAAHAIGELICNNPGEITLVAIGPLTNIAHAMQLYPQLASSVAEIAIMGGVFNVDGYLKDTNFGFDPEAAHMVLTSGANITLAPLDVTTQTQLLHQDLDKIAQIESPLSRYLVETIRPWISYSMQTRQLPGCWVHDALVVAWLLDKSIVTTGSDYLDVALEGALTRGMTLRFSPESLRLDVGIPAPKGKPVTILQAVDNKKLLATLYHALSCYH
ncbi:nucleoside hydrolase [Yersinia bercovieri]|uniref:Inosine-uridine preferring nucleoside hydrolase n=1 Tax=Yersinia bercovieri ATCC 43970 TaxID=349968 RepID=A0ABM9XYJ1_YERBE|nr:nucleoside hydrolase [Yersinia bercovieri]EEQ06496.1 Inosine-uridine preferring nucleoside hydrolase [Yersinia bercovieri ATCC 43970]MDN0101440.1 nucleoside hydrolase [Yersinia bercovieri]QKJ05964.1 nucleoside hydrolase [Yersinia bercovieri ATCC 43970]CNF66326.1 putative hydrolase [Yersinia bercovieri]CNI55697.1 putative hydrolase [Yersinia bercovieri]